MGGGDSSCSIKGPGRLQRGDKYINAKIGWERLKISSRTIGPEKF
jgi:hypothetical protein